MATNTTSILSPRLLGKTIWKVVQAIGATMRIERRYAHEDFLADTREPCVLAAWHGRMFVPVHAFRGDPIAIIVSEHRDGEILAAMLESAGYDSIRGSSTRGGVKALAGLVRHVKKGGRIAITPDGPRGPRQVFQPGTVYVAAKTGVPVVPMSGSADRAHYFGSWDSLQIPYPFSRGILLLGDPYYVTGGTDPENIEYHRRELERILTGLTNEADAIVGAKVSS